MAAHRSRPIEPLPILTARVVLGVILLVGGINGFWRVVPVPEFNGPATLFMEHLRATGLLALVKGIELAAGLVVLRGRRVPLGLVLSAPILVGIAFFHLRLDRTGFLPGAAMLTAWLAVAWDRRAVLLPLVAAERAHAGASRRAGNGAAPGFEEVRSATVSPSGHGRRVRRTAAGHPVG